MQASTSMHILIDLDICRACTRCKASRACRMKAIVQIDAGEPPYLDFSRCLDCRACIPACAFGAIRRISLNGTTTNE